MYRYAFLFAALIFAHRALSAFAILALALADMRRFLPRLRQLTLFFLPKISLAELMLFNCCCSFDASLFGADRMSMLPKRMYSDEPAAMDKHTGFAEYSRFDWLLDLRTHPHPPHSQLHYPGELGGVMLTLLVGLAFSVAAALKGSRWWFLGATGLLVTIIVVVSRLH